MWSYIYIWLLLIWSYKDYDIQLRKNYDFENSEYRYSLSSICCRPYTLICMIRLAWKYPPLVHFLLKRTSLTLWQRPRRWPLKCRRHDQQAFPTPLHWKTLKEWETLCSTEALLDDLVPPCGCNRMDGSTSPAGSGFIATVNQLKFPRLNSWRRENTSLHSWLLPTVSLIHTVQPLELFMVPTKNLLT